MKEGYNLHENESRRLTRAEAGEALREWQPMEGMPFYEDGGVLGVIECVAVSPHDTINKWIFLHFYADCRDPGKALNFYKVPFFDVILIIRTVSGQFTYRGLNAYSPPQQLAG
jgi:hypothetical protein